MDPKNCYICNTTSVFYSRNLFKTKSKYTETSICEFIKKFLGNHQSERKCIDKHCVCIECLNKIDEYDLATMTAQRVERELRDILLATESLYYIEAKSINSEELYVPSIETIETLEEFKVECFEIPASKSCSESHKFESESDEDCPSVLKCHSKYLSNNVQQRKITSGRVKRITHKCHNVAALARHEHAKGESSDLKPIIYSCYHCFEVFCTKTQYEHHLRQHKGEEEQFKCTICGFDLKERKALEEHKQLHDKLSPLQCVLCKKSFKQKGALVRHMRIHSGLNFYQCHRCGKGFIHKSSFEMHLMAHDDIRKKKCPHCNQMFRSTSHLNRHLRIHTGSKPFACPICGQKFAQRYNMNVHLRLHDTSSSRQISSKTHVCKFCNSAFARQAKLEDHLKKNHEAIIPHHAISSIGNHSDDTNE
ncbi:zinc finger protein OZF-like isoform X2 [Contarinia nasturtii]|uniref:zinc finger protein OZF-like isoform X2 n=1 Tax=Contarinia nasturtii TaxID=265458 RepID=UPI0012D3B07F|nr:zinc finger protein OZF-like isoform X2 [Contarinia nasturtii]